MSSGEVHEKYIIYASGVTLIGSVLLYDKVTPDLLLFANLGMLSNIINSPDTDQDGTILPDLRIAQMFTFWLPKSFLKEFLQGRIIRIVKIFWSIYSLNIVHRSPFSHLPILGTCIRWYYVYIMLWWLFLKHYYTLDELNHLVFEIYKNQVIIFLAFASIGDAIHTTLDGWQLNWNLW